MSIEIRKLQEFFVGALSTPTVEVSNTSGLSSISNESLFDAIKGMLRFTHRVNPRLRFDDNGTISNDVIRVELKQPYNATVAFIPIRVTDLCNLEEIIARERQSEGSTLQVIVMLVDISLPTNVKQLQEALVSAAGSLRQVVVMESEWIAGWLTTPPLPIARPLQFYGRGLNSASVDEGTLEQATSEVAVRRVRTQLSGVDGAVLSDPGSYLERLRQITSEPEISSPILVCTTFFPSVAFPASIVERFYRSIGTDNESLLAFVREKIQLERDAWIRQVANSRRIDIIERAALESYFQEPEYYQMPLTESDVRAQVAVISELLTHQNYELCITPEAIDLPFEVRGDGEVRIRTDRRNKGRPREGRIGSVVLRSTEIVGSFEREFWNIYHQTPPEFRDRHRVIKWLEEQLGSLCKK